MWGISSVTVGATTRATRPTRILRELLAVAGIHVTNPPDPDREAPVFMTNSILCIKEGKMSASILSSWVSSCTERHLLPLLRHLKAPVVVGMGGCGWRAVRQAFALRDAPARISHAAGCCWIAHDRTRVFAVGHCGPLGIINRPWPQQIADWRCIGEAVALAPPQPSS